MSDSRELPPTGCDSTPRASRRAFLKLAGAAAASAAAVTVGCARDTADDSPGSAATRGATATSSSRSALARQTLDALGDVMLPASLGAEGRRAAVGAFVAWLDGYEPVAEAMHGYGYADVRYLPPDPAPGWRAQLEGLDILARKMKQKPFAQLDEPARKSVLTAALADTGGDRLPAPLGAPHIAVALVSHWASGPAAWDLALGARVARGTCRPLDGVQAKPLSIVGATA